jgi:hypothetical protein
MLRAFSKLFICLVIPGALTAQVHNVKFKAGNFKDNPKGFKYALQKLNEGNMHIQKGEYGAALADYLAADSLNPSNADLNAKIGVCYLNSVSKAKCLPYFRLAHQIKKKISKRIDYFLARGYQLNSQWDSAIIEYQVALKTSISSDKDEINKCINECNNGNDLMQHPVKVTFENMGPNINSPYSDLRPLVTNNGKFMVFTTRRHSNLSTELSPVTGEYTEDIFTSHNKNGVWDTAEGIDPPVNTVDNDEAAALSPDGNTLYLIREGRNGDIFKCTYSENRGWSLPVALSDTINSIYSESSLCFSSDGKTMYFVSSRPGGVGGKDIYTSTMKDDSTWATPVNMGSIINTPYDEDGVFLNPDGKTLYFSSKGHNTMGGYDIFVTTLDSGKWSEPKNLGYPINTPDDDIYFSTSDNGYYGYYARITDQSKLDIFRMALDAFMPKQWIYKGTITDSATHEKLKVALDFYDKKFGADPFGADTVAGEYSLTMPANHNYVLRIRAKGYRDYGLEINVSDTATYRNMVMNIVLAKLPASADAGQAGASGAPLMSPACIPKMDVLMARFKGVVKDTSVMRTALVKMEAALCLKDLKFAVQLGLFHSTQKFNYKKYVKTASVEKLSDGTTRIISGSYTTYEEAHKLLEELKNKGLKDIFIVGVYNGKRYVLKDLLHPAN